MVLQKGNVGRLFLWDRHWIIHYYFLVKVFVPMANSFQMIKHDSKTIQLKKRIYIFLVLSIARYVYLFNFILFCRILPTCELLSIWGIHSQSRKTFRDGHQFAELNHGSKQLCIKENFELRYRIGEMLFFRFYPFWHLKPILRDFSWAYFLHAFIALANFPLRSMSP